MTIKEAGHDGAIIAAIVIAMVAIMILAQLLADGVVYLGEWAVQ